MSGTTTPTTPSYFVERMVRGELCRFDTRLETWHDPTPRESEFTLKDLREAFIKAARRSLSLVDRSTFRPSEEQLRQREEQDRKFLIVALKVYTKKNNMQPTELEFVEVKRRNLIDECGIGYLHFNFLVKGLEGKHIMFFAEVHHDLEDENDVYACMPLREDDFKPSEGNDQAPCKGCQYQAEDLVHPSCGGFLGGHKYGFVPYWDSDEERDDEFC
ncbi:uncharacterized protein LOC124675986 [Lolium rigidum]|uniref:uncharacterized protein LOC124675986 n=1 Tax=Lolium rigidum TaxID=89674 RepID=UPI001F5C29CC|nr:uncharacterized protein LOC124675986 [Lolium rigidum]